jgi:hypothetical protein
LVNPVPNNETQSNVFIYSYKSKTWDELVVGTGINDWQLDHKNTIWITYDETGLFGDVEIAQFGFVQLNLDGKLLSAKLEEPIRKERIPNILEGISIHTSVMDESWLYYDCGNDEYALVKFTDTEETTYKSKLFNHISDEHGLKWMVTTKKQFIIGDREGNIYQNKSDNLLDLEKLAVLDDKGNPISFDWMGARSNMIWAIKDSTIYIGKLEV